MDTKNRLNFGKYKGKLFSEIPDNYKLWCYDNILNWIKEKHPEFYLYLISKYNTNIDILDDDEYSENEYRQSTRAYEIAMFGSDG